MPTNNSLLFFRDKINNIDRNIVKLLAERKNLVLKIAQSKIKNKKEIRDIKREKKILNELTNLGKKYNLKPEYIKQLFQLIIEESVLTQKTLLQKYSYENNPTNAIISVLGPKGSYSYIAVYEYMNRTYQKYNIKEYSTFEKVILSLEKNQSDYAIVPIENTCSGSINEVLNCLKNTNLFIVGEINIFINHCLLAVKKIELDKIQNIYSHPQPFKQCSDFIKQFPRWNIKYTKSTSDAMKKVSEYNQKTNAALGNAIGSKLYGLQVLSQNLANQKKNITRFIILNKNCIDISKTTPNKTTLLFTIEKKSHTLSKLLSVLQEKKIIMNTLTCRISDHNSLEEIFYLDFQINLSLTMIQDIFEKIKKFTTFIKILGCYPCEIKFS